MCRNGFGQPELVIQLQSFRDLPEFDNKVKASAEKFSSILSRIRNPKVGAPPRDKKGDSLAITHFVLYQLRMILRWQVCIAVATVIWGALHKF